MRKLKKLFITIVCFWGIAIFFMASSNLSDVLGKVLHVHPSYTGGDIAKVITEPTGAPQLARYTVHKPVTNAKWQQNAEYWQLVLDFKEGVSADKQNLKIKIELPEVYEVQIQNNEGRVYDSNENYICNTELYVLNDNSQLKLRIPLQDKRLQKVLGAATTHHTIIFEDDEASFEINMKN